jgi:PucR family transcriptional regulator, purine catabolism regulatory protein
MGITVRQLVQAPHLQTRFRAGRAGGDHAINWAHSCELPEPWDWLEPFDLLLTIGLGLPTASADQVDYIERMADAGLSGVAIAEGVGAPEVTAEMADAAERRAFPILSTAYEVPFAAIARVVAESRTHSEERLRLIKTAHIYDCVRIAAVGGLGPPKLMAMLGDELDCRLRVIDMKSWHDALAPGSPASPSTTRILQEAVARSAGRLPGIIRLDLEGSSALVVPVPSRRPAALLASEFGSEPPGLSLLQHVATVAALGLEQLVSEREHRHRAGAELLTALLARRLDPVEASERLAQAGLPSRNLTVVVWESSHGQNAGRDRSPVVEAVHQELFARDVPHLMRSDEHEVVVLLPAGQRHLLTLLEVLPSETRVGLRKGLSSPLDLADAVREARWALLTHRAENGRVARYGDEDARSLPFAFADADGVAEHALGPLLRYDREHSSELVRTLAALLRNNRSANHTAEELLIHRQTLVYRTRRIEQLTGRRLNSTPDIVELWLGLRALEVTDGRVLLG